MNVRQFTVSEKMWYRGSGVTTISSASRSRGDIHATACCTLATMFRCVSMAPLGTPVVPPVYCRNARSSPATAASSIGLSVAARRRPRSSARRSGTADGSRYRGTRRLT